MDRSKIKYLISELIDNRLDLATKKELQEHLKESPDDMAYYKDQCEIKQCLLIKSYERPPADYFEQLQSTITKRILAQDIISFREMVMRYVSQPSWAKTAAVVLILGASLFLNYKYYNFYHSRYGNSAPVSQANIASPFSSLTPARPAVQPALNTRQVPIIPNRLNQPLPQNTSVRGAVFTVSTPDGQVRRVYVINPVRVKQSSADDEYKIFQ